MARLSGVCFCRASTASCLAEAEISSLSFKSRNASTLVTVGNPPAVATVATTASVRIVILDCIHFSLFLEVAFGFDKTDKGFVLFRRRNNKVDIVQQLTILCSCLVQVFAECRDVNLI